MMKRRVWKRRIRTRARRIARATGRVRSLTRKRMNTKPTIRRRSRLRQTTSRRGRKQGIKRSCVDYSFLLNRNQQELSVIISVSNEEDTIEKLLLNVQLLHPKEIIVVENGSTDRTLSLCMKQGVQCYSYSQKLGHDVGRAIGAQKATGNVLLFIDGDMVLRVHELLPFVAKCYDGKDIVLNNINPFISKKRSVDSVSLAKSFLNKVLSLSELRYSSLTAVPHAMKKSAVDLIGAVNLSVPPKAMAIAAIQGLKIGHVTGVNVITKNKIRPYNSAQNNVVEQMILGDHVEAFQYIQQHVGQRGFFPDHIRRRDLV